MCSALLRTRPGERSLRDWARGRRRAGNSPRPCAMALPSLMKHIRVLEAGGLVESQKSGRVRTCRLKPAAMTHAERWLVEQRAVWEARLDRLQAYVEKIEKKT